MNEDLPERIEALYDRLKVFPEAGKRGDDWILKPDAFLALLDLRQLLEREAIPALYQLRQLNADQRSKGGMGKLGEKKAPEDS